MSTTKLRLGPLPKTENIKLTFTCPASLKADLERYAALHSHTYGEEVDALTLIDQTPAPPVAPSGLGATAVSSSRIDLAWTDNATNESGFRLERALDGLTFAEIATLGAGVTSYSNTGLAPSTTYTYRVRAYNAVDASAYSNTASATTGAPSATYQAETATVVAVRTSRATNTAR